MARILANIPDTEAPSGNYPKGRVLNEDNTQSPPVPGTPIVEEIYGDIIQFFKKLIGLSEIIENDLPDNETNDYQYVQAFDHLVGDAVDAEATIRSGADSGLNNSKANKTIPLTDGNFASLDNDGDIFDSETSPSSFEPANSNIQNHIGSTSNPHSVTKTQVGLSNVSDNAQLKIASNLSDLNNAATARTNLDVFSKAENGGILTSAPIEIGDWDMDADSSKTVSHSLGISIDKIIGAEAWIKNDSNTSRTLLSVDAGDRISVLVDTIVLDRALGGFFDSAGYDQTSFNRGWIIIKYLP